jgi:NADH:ubiquinone oxidoreductase subunit 4 (subunit M)
MVRLFQRTMHNRVGPVVRSRDLGAADALAIAPLVAVVLALGVYPQYVLGRTGADTIAKVRAPAQAAGIAEARRGTGPPDRRASAGLGEEPTP